MKIEALKIEDLLAQIDISNEKACLESAKILAKNNHKNIDSFYANTTGIGGLEEESSTNSRDIRHIMNPQETSYPSNEKLDKYKDQLDLIAKDLTQ